MADIHSANCVKEIWLDTSSATITLSGTPVPGPPAGHLTFATLTNARDYYVRIIHTTEAEWQVARYTYAAAGTLTYVSLVASSTGSQVTFTTGTKHISVVEPFDLGLTVSRGNTPAADRFIYFSSATASALATLTAFGRSLIDDADAAAALTTLGLAIDRGRCDGRLTLATATPVTTTDQTAKTTVYFTPYKGNLVSLYNGTTWANYTFTERSITVPATTDTNYDLYLYDNAGTLTLEAVAWTNSTTRATALTTQDGVLVKTGTLTKRYLGTFRTTAVSGQTEDSEANRLLWNYYHRAVRKVKKIDTTDSWTCTSTTYQSWHNSTANRIGVVVGVAEDAVDIWFGCYGLGDNATNPLCGIGFDSTTANSADTLSNAPTLNTHGHMMHAKIVNHPAAGYHFYQALEAVSVAGTATFFGDNGAGFPIGIQCGMVGTISG